MSIFICFYHIFHKKTCKNLYKKFLKKERFIYCVNMAIQSIYSYRLTCGLLRYYWQLISMSINKQEVSSAGEQNQGNNTHSWLEGSFHYQGFDQRMLIPSVPAVTCCRQRPHQQRPPRTPKHPTAACTQKAHKASFPPPNDSRDLRGKIHWITNDPRGWQAKHLKQTQTANPGSNPTPNVCQATATARSALLADIAHSKTVQYLAVI